MDSVLFVRLAWNETADNDDSRFLLTSFSLTSGIISVEYDFL